ncbi:hypothetical protein AWB77_02485 [Caballeronia fortuita]|uniref:Uncharacterized protein n=1 Tax=Caballeronia fortuita TaxID=1777138 RepID=A0A158B5Z0_9BURK|nr:hypothetical protein AWB77_02485 [Caballeronia fortuita]
MRGFRLCEAVRFRSLKAGAQSDRYVKSNSSRSNSYMRELNVLMVTVGIALFSSATLVSAHYTEQWMPSAETARAKSKSAVSRENRKAPVAPAVTPADDDPIAAFARKPVRR